MEKRSVEKLIAVTSGVISVVVGFWATSSIIDIRIKNQTQPQASVEENMDKRQSHIAIGGMNRKDFNSANKKNYVTLKKSELDNLVADVSMLKDAFVVKPEYVVTVAILSEKAKIQDEEVKRIKDEIQSVKEDRKWYYSTIVAIAAALLVISIGLYRK